jgi:hypothetical protein
MSLPQLSVGHSGAREERSARSESDKFIQGKSEHSQSFGFANVAFFEILFLVETRNRVQSHIKFTTQDVTV